LQDWRVNSFWPHQTNIEGDVDVISQIFRVGTSGKSGNLLFL
jgi:hypothetical protein